jgi:tetratricopeptide (TPR) repeat protein
VNNFMPTIIGAAIITIVQPSITIAQSINNINQIAKEITVQIESPGDPGSGVIIGKQDNTYYVLTARHVIKDIQPVEGNEGDLTTYDGEHYDLDANKIVLLPNNIDLALVQFNSKKEYPIATISNYNYQLYKNRDYESNNVSEQTEQYVFVSGFPLEVEQRIFNSGILYDNSGIAVSANYGENFQQESGGYELVYTNLTHPGMSGGAVLDTQGRLIGIHGRGDGRNLDEQDRVIRQYLEEVGPPVKIKIGVSLGIPIQSFLSWAADRDINKYLKVESSTPVSLPKTTIESWNPPIEAKESTPFFWLEKGNQLWRVGRVAEARGSFEKAISLRPDYALSWYAKGFASGFDQKYNIALEACDRAIQLDPNYYEAYRCKSGALQELQQYEPALQSLDRAIELNPHNPSDFLAQGELRYALQQYQTALESLDKAIELRQKYHLSRSALLYNNRGLVRVSLEQYELAIKDTEEAINIDKNYASAWQNKGFILQKMERYEESIAAFDRALELDPKDYYAWTNRGVVLYKMEDYSKAEESLKKALEINPEYQPAIDNLEAVNSVINE